MARRRSPKKRLLALLALVLLLALLLPLPGWLSGGGREGERGTEPPPRVRPEPPGAPRRGAVAIDPEAWEPAGFVRYPDGRPARAEVSLLSGNGGMLATTRTTADGAYALPPHPGAAFVRIEPEDGAPAVVRGGDVVVRDGVAVSGEVAGAGGGFLDVHVRVAGPGLDGTVPLRLRWPVDDAGRWRGRLPDDAGAAWGVRDGIPFPLRGPRPETAPFSGRVVRARGGPAPGAVVSFLPLDGGLPAPVPPLVAHADDDGRFSFARFPRVPCAALVAAPGCATRRIDEVSPADRPLEIVLQDGFSVRGIVTDAEGRPVSGAAVRGVGLPDATGERPPATTVTGTDGRFTLDGLSGDHVALRVEAAGLPAASVRDVRPDEHVEIVLRE